MPPKVNIKIGSKFGNWTVVSQSEVRKNGNIYWVCICDCGIKKHVQGRNLLNKLSLSCGCLRVISVVDRLKTHGLSKSKIYTIWQAMKSRCLNKNNVEYKNYGGRGIKICKRWQQSFEEFYKDMHIEYRDGLELERKNVNGHYYKNNCKWATRKEQQRNKRNNHYFKYNGQNKTLVEWEEITGIKANTILTRIRRGWAEEKILLKLANQ